MKGICEMLILGENETCPHNKRCPNKEHDGLVNGFCDGLNPFRNTVFKCEIVRNDGTFEDVLNILNYLVSNGNRP